MKLIHTADWHLGNSMHDMDRKEEFKQFLFWLRERIVESKAECLVVAGDIFDTANPSTEARGLYFQFLASLFETCCKNIIVVGGNHDSGSMLDAPRDVLEVLNIQVVGTLGERPIEELVKELKDKFGNVIGISAAVPYVREMELRRFKSESEEDFATNTYKEMYKAVFAAAEKLRNNREIPIVATGHLYASQLEGRPENDSENFGKEHGVRDIVGNLGKVPVSVFPVGFDYTALGHIHYATRVAKNPRVRYSGSPFVLGFDEAEIPHHVLLVDVKKDKEPIVEKIETPKYYSFKRVSGSIESIQEQLISLKENPSELPLKVEIHYDYTIGVNVRESLSSILENAPFEVVSWKVNRKGSLSAVNFSDESMDSVDVLDEKDVFEKLVLSKLGKTEKDEEVNKKIEEYLPLFMQVVKEVEEEEGV